MALGFLSLTNRWFYGAEKGSVLLLIISFFVGLNVSGNTIYSELSLSDNILMQQWLTGIKQTNQNDSLMGFLPDDNGKTYYYFSDGMMRDRTADNGDNLWRTSLAYIAYNHPDLREGMLRCLKWTGEDKVQFYRSVEQDKNDVSRDQITMFLAAMKYHGHDIKKIVKATPYKISDKYKLTPDMWLWMRAAAGSTLARRLFYMIEWPVVKVYQLWNKSNISKRKFPAYALHLLAWQLYVLDGNASIKRSIQNMVEDMGDEENYLVKLLSEQQVTEPQVDSVTPHTDFIWQRYRQTANVNLRPLTPEEAEFNTLDVDVLKAVFERECCD
ncbi:MAG: hypothetical protein KDC05_15980 [Bacteroidales bacterium]|nr:hypothetical protein [Bacteroidales bacterium]